ncbi:hypothetical protein AWB80_01026 [Caballeronia pedi]|uniref:Uncharacterized protein n=1 Tax=Caballeronia pedi TaxID=1777141 RepID=A0A157ZMV7_9BURK|nr:hypothetical protein AWB80_01026 [Caballeronia pedi]
MHAQSTFFRPSRSPLGPSVNNRDTDIEARSRVIANVPCRWRDAAPKRPDVRLTALVWPRHCKEESPSISNERPPVPVASSTSQGWRFVRTSRGGEFRWTNKAFAPRLSREHAHAAGARCRGRFRPVLIAVRLLGLCPAIVHPPRGSPERQGTAHRTGVLIFRLIRRRGRGKMHPRSHRTTPFIPTTRSVRLRAAISVVGA